jgi:tetratricopeptide (TPR) repeat protein
MKIYFCALLLFVAKFSFSQQSDSLKAEHFIALADNYWDSHTDSAKHLMYSALKLKLPENSRIKSKIYRELGFVYYANGQYDSSIVFHKKSEQINRVLKDTFQLIKDLNNTASSLLYDNKYLASLKTYYLALDLVSIKKNEKQKSQIYNNIGLVYQSFGDLDKALEYGKKSLDLKLALNDTIGTAGTLGNIGNLLYSKKNYDSALTYFSKSIRLFTAINDSTYAATQLVNLANTYFEKGDYINAINSNKKALALNITMPDIAASIYLSLFNSYIYSGNESKAIETFKLFSSQKFTTTELIRRKEIAFATAKYNVLIGNKNKALQELLNLRTMEDSIALETQNLEFQKIAIKFDLDKKVYADSLAMQNQVSIAKTKTVQTQNRLLLVSLVLIMALGIALFSFNRSKNLKRKNIIAEQEKQIAEQLQNTYQLKALQAQMNPHFVFNCFSTIDSFILQNKQLEASKLVQRFSKLSRRVLEQTSLNYISIEEELETLQTYLQIERTRSSGKFNFRIEKQEQILHYQIPPMLLQPFVENAVIHGVRYLKETEGLIKISFKEQDDNVIVSIEDNGIGREKAAAIKQQNQNTHRSVSMDLTLSRLKSLHQNSSLNYLEIIDLKDDKIGTLVKVIIPKILNNA